jgi:hypothetical protein
MHLSALGNIFDRSLHFYDCHEFIIPSSLSLSDMISVCHQSTSNASPTKSAYSSRSTPFFDSPIPTTNKRDSDLSFDNIALPICDANNCPMMLLSGIVPPSTVDAVKCAIGRRSLDGPSDSDGVAWCSSGSGLRSGTWT